MKTLSVALTLVPAATAGTLLHARYNQPGPAGANSTETFHDLNLTDEQEAKITDIRKEYRPKIYEAGNKLRADVRGGIDDDPGRPPRLTGEGPPKLLTNTCHRQRRLTSPA
jgi:hypothetical protein